MVRERRWTKVILGEGTWGLCLHLELSINQFITSLPTHQPFQNGPDVPLEQDLCNCCPYYLECSPATSLWDLRLSSNYTSLGYHNGPETGSDIHPDFSELSCYSWGYLCLFPQCTVSLTSTQSHSTLFKQNQPVYFNEGLIQVLLHKESQLLNTQFLINIKNLGEIWDHCHKLGYRTTFMDRGTLLLKEMKHTGWPNVPKIGKN